MKIAIVGSRDFDDFDLLEKELEPYKDKITVVVSGGARGADNLAEQWAELNHIKKKIIKPDWDDIEGKPSHLIGKNSYGEYYKLAGLERNTRMAEFCDGCIAFWDGESSGTKQMISECDRLNKPTKIINV